MNKFNSSKNNKKIIDSFSFFNEFDLLKLRLNYLNDIVDYFLICECNHTYSAIPKPYYLDEVIDDIPENIRKKIIRIKYEVDGRHYCHVNEEGRYCCNNPWELENGQRDFIGKNLSQFSPDDIIMVSDLDEIPNKNAIEKILNLWEDDSLYSLKSDWFLYNFNTFLPDSWWGTCFSSIQKCIENGSQWMRDNGAIIFNKGMESNTFKIIDNGGWHFSYFSDVEKIKIKIESYAHQEFNKQEYKNFIYLNDCINNKKSFYHENLYFFDYNFNDFPEELKKLIIDIFPENYYKN